MKFKITFLIGFLFTTLNFAQQPINYKALVKDGSGNVVANQNITVQFQILQGAGMTNVYQETHAPNTDTNGIVIVNIGDGSVDSGVFIDIDWGSDDHFLNVQINTGSGLIDMGTTQFMAVPYALNALTTSDNYWSKNGNNVYNLDNNIGIGTSVPLYSLDISSTTGIGSRVNMIGDATGTKYGSYIQVLTTGDFQQFGTYNNVQGNGNANHHGTFNNMGGDGGGTKYGTYNSLNGDGNGIHYGNYSTVIGNGSGNHYGYYSDIIANGSGANFGSRNILSGSGTGNKFGTFNTIDPAAGGGHFGIFSEVLKPGSFAAYFLGNVSIGTNNSNLYIFPASRGNDGDIMQTDGFGNVLWVSYETPTGLEVLDEGNGSGWRLVNAIPTSYGNIGFQAVDLSYSDFTSSTLGATGLTSVAMGFDTTASGDASLATGADTTASGNFSTALGLDTTSLGDRSTAMGHQTISRAYASTAIGRYNFGGGNISNWIATDRLFEVGNGASDAARSNALTILKNGNIGISTPIPNTKLHITDGGDADLTNGSGYFLLGQESGINIVMDNNEIMARNSGGNSTLYFQIDGGAVNVGDDLLVGGNLTFSAGAIGINYQAGSNYLHFGNGSTPNYFPGNIGISGGNISPNAALDVTGNIEYTGTITDVSDARLKENFKSIENPLQRLLRLQTYTYNMKDDERKKIEYGVIAQEMLKIFPEMVSIVDEENGYLGVSYIQLIPVLIEAIKEQQGIIETQEQKIESQENTLKAVLDRLDTLEAKNN